MGSQSASPFKKLLFLQELFCVLISGFEPKGSVNSDYNFCSRRFAVSIKNHISVKLTLATYQNIG